MIILLHYRDLSFPLRPIDAILFLYTVRQISTPYLVRTSHARSKHISPRACEDECRNIISIAVFFFYLEVFIFIFIFNVYRRLRASRQHPSPLPAHSAHVFVVLRPHHSLGCCGACTRATGACFGLGNVPTLRAGAPSCRRSYWREGCPPPPAPRSARLFLFVLRMSPRGLSVVDCVRSCRYHTTLRCWTEMLSTVTYSY